MAIARYLAKRALFLGITYVAATYMVVVIANFGGVVDNFLIQQIKVETLQELNNSEDYQRLRAQDPEAAERVFNERVEERIESAGLNEPFIPKSFRQTADALTLSLGRALHLRTAAGSEQLWDLIIERLPRTILLFTSATALSAFIGIWLGLRMARKALSAMDRSLTVVSITTLVVPSWVFAIFFLLIFAFGLRVVPSGGMFSVPAPTEPTALALDMGYHLLLPLATVTFSQFGGWSYITRNLVLQIMDEDFVTVARSKGLPEKVVLNRYVLRAASPPIVTSLALALIVSWTGAIITELIFNWPGLGLLYWEAILIFDAPVIIGLTVVYAFLFVLTIFILDAVYSFLDPRIKALR